MVEVGKGIICPYCGARVDKVQEDGTYKCSYCGNASFIDIKEVTIDFRDALNKIKAYKFKEADDVYSNIIREFSSTSLKIKAMALWGRILAQFGVVYVRSFDREYFVPTFAKYNPKYKSIKESSYYNDLLNLDLDKRIKEKYINKCLELDNHYTQIEKDLKETPVYDVFLCTKISNTTEEHPELKGYSVDKEIAERLKEKLERQGKKVFYSETCVGGVHYDSQIYSAMSKSKSILVVSTCKEYLESAWVQSEWRRWLNFIDVKVKNENSFFLYLPNYKDNLFTLPLSLEEARVQYWTQDKLDLMINNIDSVSNLYSKRKNVNDKIKRITIENIKKDDNSNLFKNVEPRKLGANNVTNNNTSIKQKLNTAKSRFIIGKKDEALKIIEEVLSVDKTNSEALKYKFMCELNINDFSLLKNDLLYLNINKLNELILSLDALNAKDILEKVSNNFIISFKDNMFKDKEVIDILNVLLVYDFDKRKDLLDALEIYALNECNYNIYEAISKFKGFKTTEEYLEYFSVYLNNQEFDLRCEEKKFELNPNNKEMLLDLSIKTLLSLDVNDLFNSLNKFKDNYFIKYLSFCDNDLEKIHYINVVIHNLERVVANDIKVIEMPSILLWTYKNIFLYYPEDFDFRKEINDLFNKIKIKEKDVSIELCDLLIAEYSGFDDSLSSKCIIDTACYALITILDMEDYVCFNNNCFDDFVKQINDIKKIDIDQIKSYIDAIINRYEFSFDELSSDSLYTNRYAFAFNLISNINKVIKEMDDNFNKNKELYLNKMKEYKESDYIGKELKAFKNSFNKYYNKIKEAKYGEDYYSLYLLFTYDVKNLKSKEEVIKESKAKLNKVITFVKSNLKNIILTIIALAFSIFFPPFIFKGLHIIFNILYSVLLFLIIVASYIGVEGSIKARYKARRFALLFQTLFGIVLYVYSWVYSIAFLVLVSGVFCIMACLFQYALRHINDSWNDKDFNLVMGTYIGVTIVITFILLVVDSFVYFG